MRKTIEHAAVVGEGAATEETHRIISDIDEQARVVADTGSFCVVTHKGIGPDDIRLVSSGRSATEMVIAAAALSVANGLDPVSVCLLGPASQPGSVMITFGNPYAVAAVWAARAGATESVAEVVAHSTMAAVQGIVESRLQTRGGPVTEH